ncbi:hypothetical protein ACP4OV_025131 [Aristida adscensionis]
MAGRGRGGYSFGYGQIDVADGHDGRGGRGAGVPPVAMPPGFYSPDGLDMPPPAEYRQYYVLAGIDWFYTAFKHDATPYWFVDFSYLKLHAMEAEEEVTTYLRNFTCHYACPMDLTYHRRVHVSQSLNYILADAVDMIGYDVELERTQSPHSRRRYLVSSACSVRGDARKFLHLWCAVPRTICSSS